MQKPTPIRNLKAEVELITKRATAIGILLGALVFLLIGRLAYLQIIKKDIYTTLSARNSLDLIPVEPTRGLIYDRNGVLLAENIPVFSLDISPYQMANLPYLLITLRKIITLTDADIAQFQKQRIQHRRMDEIPLKIRLTPEEVAHVAENQYRLPGIILKARLMRYYPLSESFSHVLGYVGRINQEELSQIDATNYSASHYIGKLGIEKYYEEELHGTVGYEQVENDASGKKARTIKTIPAVPGKNLYLTIDSKLQLEAEKALGNHRGAMVIIQPATGQILAMVSKPGFDPNLFVTGISYKEYKILQSAKDKPLYNRATQGLYPLASTIKPFIALEGLNSGATTPEYSYFDPGWFELENSSHRFHDWRHHGHGTINLTKAIVSSCDTYFFNLAMKLGIHRIDHILTEFGYGAPTGIDLDEEASGIIASPEWKRRVKGMPWYPGDTVISAIGQGYMQTTPLQLAAATAILANRGQRNIPYLLWQQQTPGTNAAMPQGAIPLDSVVLRDKQSWKIVIDAMAQVMSSPQGTGHRFGLNPGYTIAGKTGTAQVFSQKITSDSPDMRDESYLPEQLRDHSLFIAFAPVDNPQIAVAVVVENDHSVIQVAKSIFDYYLLNKKSA